MVCETDPDHHTRDARYRTRADPTIQTTSTPMANQRIILQLSVSPCLLRMLIMMTHAMIAGIRNNAIMLAMDRNSNSSVIGPPSHSNISKHSLRLFCPEA
jgi:hypothetical protein